VPWLALVLYTQADERRATIAGVDSDAMRVIRIVTSNQAAQIEAARQLLTGFARLPSSRRPMRPAAMRSSRKCWPPPVVPELRGGRAGRKLIS